jgi:hypothetical protein
VLVDHNISDTRRATVIIADRVALLMRAEGGEDVLINTGEILAIGAPNGRDAWPVNIHRPEQRSGLIRTCTCHVCTFWHGAGQIGISRSHSRSAHWRCVGNKRPTDIHQRQSCGDGRRTNVYGVIGRPVGSLEGFDFDESITATGAAGIVWNEEKLAAYATDPIAWLQENLDDPTAKTKMTFKIKT